MSSNFETDADIVAILRAGDVGRSEDVCRRLYLGVGRQIKLWYLAKGATPSQADDWIQETFVKMLRSLDQYHGDNRFNAWVWMIGRNVRIDALRGARRRNQMLVFDDLSADAEDGVGPEAADPAPGPLEEVVRIQYLECLQQAFERFTRDFPDRAEVLLWVVDGISVTDIAARRGKSAGAMREDLSQTRKKIRGYSAHCMES